MMQDTKINWSRGLLRFWALLGALWVIVATITLYDGSTIKPVKVRIEGHGDVLFPPSFLGLKPEEQNRAVEAAIERVKEGERAKLDAAAWSDVYLNAARFAAAISLPPILLLMLGIALRWVVRGFRPKAT